MIFSHLSPTLLSKNNLAHIGLGNYLGGHYLWNIMTWYLHILTFWLSVCKLYMCVYTTMDSFPAFSKLLPWNYFLTVLESYHNSKAFLLEKHGEVKDPHIFCPISYYFPVLEGNKMWRQPEFLLCLSFLFSYISRRIMAFLTHNDMRPSLLTSKE